MIKAFALMLSAASMVIASNATNLAKKDVLFAWSPWSECQEGKRERSSFQKIKEVENCYGQGSDSQKSAQYGDCYELYQAGYTKPDVYTIEIRTGVTAKVKCSEWGWTVIQSRGQFGNPVDYFDRDWKTYQEGFGTPGEEHWLGLNNIYDLTDKKRYKLRITMTDFHRNEKIANYEDFHLEDRIKYALHLGKFSGNVGNDFAKHNGMKFSTKDQDNDIHGTVNCAASYGGGWWWTNCHTVNLNSNNYGVKGKVRHAHGIHWASFTTYDAALRKVEMAVKPM